MPHYKKAFDIGTYTGNGGQLRIGIPTLRGVGSTGTQVAGATRWRSSAPTYLSRTPASAGNRKTWTWSFWIKRSSLGTNQEILVAYAAANDTGNFEVRFTTTDQLYIYGWASTWRATTLAFRDTTTWQHIVIAADTTLATAADRIKVYVNGSRVTSFAASADPTQNSDLGVNSAAIHRISGNSIPDGLYFDGYLSQMYMIDGQHLTSSSFGEFNSDGIWVAKAYSGTYGTNGFYLPMNSSSNFATDQSGNGNNWTPTGFNTTTANTTYDLFTDSPTDYGTDTGTGAQVRGNYATLNPISTSGGTVSFGGLRAVGPSSWRRYSTFLPVNSGKWYWEATNIGSPYSPRGTTTSYKWMGWQIVSDTNSTSSPSGGSLTNCLVYGDNGYYINFSTTQVDGGSAISNNDVMAMAVDLDANTFTIYRNNVSIASGSMGAGRVAGSYLWPVVWSYDGSYGDLYCNFGQRAFTYTAPSGYKAICTANIDKPADSSLWFYGDTPDLMWIKNRGVGGSNVLQDTVRGINFALFSDTDGVDQGYPYVMEMNKFGMSLQLGTGVNAAGVNFVYWAWKAGSNTSSTSVTNTNGSITSQVSANRQAGFSIVSYTGTGANGTVGHGLGTAPSMIICKRRVTTAGDWQTYHISVGNTGTLKLNSTTATITSSAVWNNTSPTSSVFSLGSGGDANLSGDPFVAYCWAAIPGYSAFGSYAGNGASDGPFVYTGFSPRWLMVKSITAASASNWCIYDVVRQTYNQLRNPLYANANSQEPSLGIAFDIVSNGFKLREGGGQGNDSGVTYIYAAFAETPFKFARAR